ncbi:MAG: leucine-rich repeat protein [Clostridia bacterium]|nr:leucine-rich repeat protein [Clostridia bacterium]
MKKSFNRLISVLLVALTVFSLTVFSASAFTTPDEMFDFNAISDGMAEIVNFDQSSTDVVIPEKVTDANGNEYTVVSISRDTFGDTFAAKIESISIPGSIKTIKSAQFQNFTSLKSVTLGNGIETIGNSAFSGCTSLKSITLPDSVTKIDSFAFGDCSSLESVKISNNVTEIPSTAFDRCSSLKTVTLGYNTASVNETAFRGCIALTDIYCYDAISSFPVDSIDTANVTFHCYPDSDFYSFVTENRLDCVTYAVTGISVTVVDESKQYYPTAGTVPSLTTDGLKVSAHYEGAPDRDVTAKSSVTSDDDFTTPGDKDAQVTYFGKYADFTVKVYGLDKLLVTVTDPEMQKYPVTDDVKLHKEGIKVVADYINADDVDVTNECTLSTQDDFTTPGEKTVTVSYGGKTATFNVTVYGLSELLVTVTDPEMQKYPVTDDVMLHKEGIKVVADYINADDVDVTNECTLSTQDDFTTPGEKTVTVSYKNKTATFKVFVYDFKFTGSISALTMNYKDPYRFTINSEFMPEDAKITWKSSNPKILTVDKDGNIKTLKRGTATVTAIIEGTDLSVSCNVTVKYTWWQWIIIILLFGWIWY